MGCDCSEMGYLGADPWWQQVISTGERIATQVLAPAPAPYPGIYTPPYTPGAGYQLPGYQPPPEYVEASFAPAETNWLPWLAVGGLALFLFTKR